MRQLILFAALLGVVAAGCGSADPVVTKEEEKAFRNPPKEMPAAAVESMKKAGEEAKKRSEANSTNPRSNSQAD